MQPLDHNAVRRRSDPPVDTVANARRQRGALRRTICGGYRRAQVLGAKVLGAKVLDAKILGHRKLLLHVRDDAGIEHDLIGAAHLGVTDEARLLQRLRFTRT